MWANDYLVDDGYLVNIPPSAGGVLEDNAQGYKIA